MSSRQICGLILAAGLSFPPAALALDDHGHVSEMIGDGIARFHASAEARDNRIPSFALESPRESIGTVPNNWPVKPVYSREGDRGVVTIDIEPTTDLYGTGQAAGPLRRNGRVTEAWNFDAYGYQDDSDYLYTSHPWVLAVREDGTSFGILYDSTYRVEMDLTEDIVFKYDGRDQPIIVIDGPTPQDVMVKLGDLTGTIEMPPKWAIGYHQCRYSYFPDSRVKEVADTFRQKRIPGDVIWMDIDYMDGFRCFTFDQELFPNPAELNSYLDSIGWSNVWMINPGIKNEDGYFIHDAGNEVDAWVQTADGGEYRGFVWPGECVFPDYTNKDVREWWATLYEPFMANGIDGVWNDMNEPAIFNVESKTMPLDNIHRADPAFGGEGPHSRFHNVYGMLMVKASREGIMAANPDKRPFVLSRANYIGGHRYGATWTGDNTANWYHVDASIGMTLNLGLSGQPFVGPDIGGFAGNGTGEMFARWMGFGALMPFSRGHTAKGNVDKEPWSFGQEVEDTTRRALERRYRLMPLFYTLFEESHRTGMPVARPTFFADPADLALRSEDDSFLLGENLLVVADPTPGNERVQIIPRPVEGVAWREFDFPSFDGGRDSKDPDQPKLMIRPGGIVPAAPVHQHFGDRPDQRDELTLLIHLGADGRAEGELYEDAGTGWGFREGEFIRSKYTAERRGQRIVIETETLEGDMTRPSRTLIARVLLPNGEEIVARGRDGRTLTVRMPR
ncbi:MAG: TIM-barrel domain-containing protein [Planctomycetota bacterium]